MEIVTSLQELVALLTSKLETNVVASDHETQSNINDKSFLKTTTQE